MPAAEFEQTFLPNIATTRPTLAKPAANAA
jgi:hypothetical protein